MACWRGDTVCGRSGTVSAPNALYVCNTIKYEFSCSISRVTVSIVASIPESRGVLSDSFSRSEQKTHLPFVILTPGCQHVLLRSFSTRHFFPERNNLRTLLLNSSLVSVPFRHAVRKSYAFFLEHDAHSPVRELKTILPHTSHTLFIIFNLSIMIRYHDNTPVTYRQYHKIPEGNRDFRVRWKPRGYWV